MDIRKIINKVVPILTSVLIGVIIAGVIITSWVFFQNSIWILAKINRKMEIYHLQQQLQVREIQETIKGSFELIIENDIKQLQFDKNVVSLLDSMTGNIETLKENNKDLARRLQTTKLIDVENVDQIKQANVLVGNVNEGIEGSGTHIKINGESYLLTCAHLIIENEDDIIGILDNGDMHPLQLVKINRETDLALFKIYGVGDLPYFKIADVEPKEGSEIIVVGNPNRMTDVITDGILAKINEEGYIFTNLIYSGSSGGAMLYKGKVIGIVSEFRVCFTPPIFVNYGYAVKLNTIKDFLGDIK